MTDERKDDEAHIADGPSTRRTLLKLGAMAAPAVVTLKPAMAAAQVSLAMCRIPLNAELDKNGKLRPHAGIVEAAKGGGGGGGGDVYYAPPAKGYYLGQELIDYQESGRLPDGIYSEDHFDAHIKYIKNLRPGDEGFTCLVSLVHKI